MHKRLPLLALCLTVAALGISACGPSGDSDSGTPATSASTSTSASEEKRGLDGPSAKLYVETIRKQHPDLSHIEDDVLVTHGNAGCKARGQDFVDQVKKTKEELEISGPQASAILGTAHGFCGRNAFR
ncbi:hypothetical protein [Streptomyces sp. URMC 124]|uniref:hypothetical protein n=1 Tax=Streptomyces sp. URMC 124 TaxID=3423405 RepID=UPI003F1C0C41